jgi:hypothetical protein
VENGCIGIQQLLAGPDAPLMRALAAPLHVAEFWQYADEQQMLEDVGGPAELLFALKACDYAGGKVLDVGEECCCPLRYVPCVRLTRT